MFTLRGLPSNNPVTKGPYNPLITPLCDPLTTTPSCPYFHSQNLAAQGPASPSRPLKSSGCGSRALSGLVSFIFKEEGGGTISLYSSPGGGDCAKRDVLMCAKLGGQHFQSLCHDSLDFFVHKSHGHFAQSSVHDSLDFFVHNPSHLAHRFTHDSQDLHSHHFPIHYNECLTPYFAHFKTPSHKGVQQ